MPRTSTTVIFTLLSLIFAGCGTTPLTSTVTATTIPTVIPTSTGLPTSTAIPSPVPDMVYVNPSVSLGPISPLIYGSNYGPWLTVSFDMLPEAYDSGITILRFPAGSWSVGDHNDVRTYVCN